MFAAFRPGMRDRIQTVARAIAFFGTDAESAVGDQRLDLLDQCEPAAVGRKIDVAGIPAQIAAVRGERTREDRIATESVAERGSGWLGRKADACTPR
jgi:hypothetical protein